MINPSKVRAQGERKVSRAENPHTDWYPAGVYSWLFCSWYPHMFFGDLTPFWRPLPCRFLNRGDALSSLTSKHPTVSLVSMFAPTGGLLGQDLRTHVRISSKFPWP